MHNNLREDGYISQWNTPIYKWKSIHLSIYVASTDTQQIGSINLHKLYGSLLELECG